MKIPVILLALAAATPALSQTPTANAPVATPVAEAIAPANWEFSPDFLRDQNRIVWSAPNATGTNKFFVTTTDGAGASSDEIVNFPDINGKTLTTLTTKLNKIGALQTVEAYDAVRNRPIFLQNAFNNGVVPIVIKDNAVSLQTVAANSLLAKRTFTLDLAQLKGTLVCDYDALGRRQHDIFTAANGASRSINYVYGTKGLSQITDEAAITTIERDADGKMRSLSAMQNGLLTRSATPITNDKGAIIGTRIEDYSGGILQQVNETTQENGTKISRTSQTSSDKTTFQNGQQTTEKKFDFRTDTGPKTPAVAAIEVRKHILYKNAKIVSEELFRGGVLTRRSEFNANGVISKVTDFNADGSVASKIDASVISGFYVDGTE